MSNQTGIARTYRVATKIGDDYFTIEEVVTLPMDATDTEIEQAVALGQRIYVAQQEAVFAQLATLRAAFPIPVRPATRPQLNAVAKLRGRVSLATVGAVYQELEIAGAEPATIEQASALIERLSAIVDGRAPDPGVASFDAAAASSDTDGDLPF